MQIIELRQRSTRPRFFASPKCKVAIPVRDSLLRDALQQASLEPAVRAIRYRTRSDIQHAEAPLTGIVLDRIDGTFLLRVWERLPRRSEEQLERLADALANSGLRLFERDALDIKREPLFSNAREVWSHERYHIPLRDRLRIAAALADEGPQTIIELEERACPGCDIFAGLCSLACENLIELDIRDMPLGSRTVVRGR